MNYQLSIIHYQLLRNLTAAMFAGAIFVFLPGCPPATSSTTAPAQENPLIGPCADQLGDVACQFMLYFKVYKNLPPQIQDLARVGTINVPLACPTTHAPYTYNPDGLTVPNWTGRLILYDSRPHGDFRRGILVERIKPGQPLVAHVIPISEKDFQAAKPASDATSRPAPN